MPTIGHFDAPVDDINSQDNESFPYIPLNVKKIFFTRIYMETPTIFCPKRNNGIWSTPELIISQFAGEPTLDKRWKYLFCPLFL